MSACCTGEQRCFEYPKSEYRVPNTDYTSQRHFTQNWVNAYSIWAFHWKAIDDMAAQNLTSINRSVTSLWRHATDVGEAVKLPPNYTGLRYVFQGDFTRQTIISGVRIANIPVRYQSAFKCTSHSVRRWWKKRHNGAGWMVFIISSLLQWRTEMFGVLKVLVSSTEYRVYLTTTLHGWCLSLSKKICFKPATERVSFVTESRWQGGSVKYTTSLCDCWDIQSISHICHTQHTYCRL